MSAKAFLIDLSERVGSTFAITFLTVSYAGAKVMWADSAAIAGLAAVGSLLTTSVVWLTALKAITNPYVDLVYRGAITFCQTLGGYVAAAGLISALDFHWSFALKAALAAAGTALLKGLIGLNNPRTLGASSLLVRADGSEHPRKHKHLVA